MPLQPENATPLSPSCVASSRGTSQTEGAFTLRKRKRFGAYAVLKMLWHDVRATWVQATFLCWCPWCCPHHDTAPGSGLCCPYQKPPLPLCTGGQIWIYNSDLHHTAHFWDMFNVFVFWKLNGCRCFLADVWALHPGARGVCQRGGYSAEGKWEEGQSAKPDTGTRQWTLCQV